MRYRRYFVNICELTRNRVGRWEWEVGTDLGGAAARPRGSSEITRELSDGKRSDYSIDTTEIYIYPLSALACVAHVQYTKVQIQLVCISTVYRKRRYFFFKNLSIMTQ